jgi:hypothetical protein
VPYWTLRDRNLLEQISTPITASREEWSEAFMDLSKLVVEGFEVAFIRSKLDAASVAYGANDQSIALLEKLRAATDPLASTTGFEGLRTVQRIRSKVKATPAARKPNNWRKRRWPNTKPSAVISRTSAVWSQGRWKRSSV